MVNKTIEDGLKPYALGEKLTTLRLRKSMGLVELGKHTASRRQCFQNWSAASCFRRSQLC